MPEIVMCASLDEVRANINRIDTALVRLLAERGAYVQQAAGFKRTADDVRAPARVEQVILRVRDSAEHEGASPDVVERVYRAMIAAFIDEELRAHARMPRATE
jgi:isochorismate pyruvate lyase